jgi:hypothetical protein
VAKTRTKSQSNSRIGFYILLILTLAAPIIAGLFFADARGVPYGWFIAVVWLVITLATCLFGIFYYGQFVLPSHKGENWWQGVAMILRAATHGEESPRSAGLKAAAPTFPGEELLPPSFKTLQAGMLPSHLVLAVSKGNSFSRAAGPGFVKLQPGERITQAIDLRRHWRSQELTVNTRDGIPLETSITVQFKVKESTTRSESERLPYPYDKNAVFLVSQLSSVDKNEHIQPWSEQVAPQAATFMVSEFAQFTLDELSQDPLIFKGIERRVKHQLLATFDVFGIVIQAVQVAAHNVPEQVVAQRLAVWRSPWQSRLRILTAAGNEEALKQFKLARANAQIEIIEKIMASIDEMRHVEDANLSDIVAIRAVDVLENASAKSAAQLMLPSHIFNSLPGQGPQQETGTAENSSAEQNRE